VVEPIHEGRQKKYKKDDITAMSIIMDSIKEHIIPCISKLDTLNKMYDSLNKLYIVNNIVQAMSLRNELHDIRRKKNNIMDSYFVRVSTLRDQIQAMDEIVSNK